MSVVRLLELIEDPEATLDRIMAVIACVDPGAPSENDIVLRLDHLADQISATSADTVITDVLGGLGFTGNAANYYDARNSLLHCVLDRRLGIPLSLAVVVVEIARRRGVALRAIGMPGHVLLGDRDAWYDPFAGGVALDRDGCEQIFRTVHPDAPFLDDYLAPMSHAAIATRTLANLRVATMGSGNLSQLASVLELRAELPEAPIEFRVEYARLLAALGRYDQAAAERDRLADLAPTRSDHHLAEASRLRAHRN